MNREPIHPGEFLADELEEIGLKQATIGNYFYEKSQAECSKDYMKFLQRNK